MAKARVKKKVKAKAKAKKVSPRSAAKVGGAVSDFALPSTDGTTVALSSLRGKVVVLYFYPKDSTPGCTLEGHDFSRLHKEFVAAGAAVFGVSRDSLKSHEKFRSRENLTIDLLSDEDEKVCKQFKVIKMKNMYGRQVRGIERSTFVVDADGQLVKEWRGVKVPGHAEDVLKFVKEL